jgi:hypothetical protein
MMYAKIDNGAVVAFPLYEGDIRAELPNYQFPYPFVPPANYVVVWETDYPVVDYTKYVQMGAPVLVGNDWKQKMKLLPCAVAGTESFKQATGLSLQTPR